MIKKILIGLVALVLLLVGASAYILTHPPTELAHDSERGEEAHGNAEVTQEATAEAAERDFLEHMIPHHGEAVATAQTIVERSNNAEVKDLAQAIIAAQETEITNMKDWYQTWYGSEFKADGDYHVMMPDLSGKTGAELDRAFLEGMIEHHFAALNKAQEVAPYIQHDEIRTLVKNIAETQSAEMVKMRVLLKQI